MSTAVPLDPWVALALLLVVAAGVWRWTDRTAHLGLTLFRPYRGDPWPIGVQEDDDVRFDWSPSRALGAAAAAPDVAGVGHDRRAIARADAAAPIDEAVPAFEDLSGAVIDVERLGPGSVRRAGR